MTSQKPQKLDIFKKYYLWYFVCFSKYFHFLKEQNYFIHKNRQYMQYFVKFEIWNCCYVTVFQLHVGVFRKIPLKWMSQCINSGLSRTWNLNKFYDEFTFQVALVLTFTNQSKYQWMFYDPLYVIIMYFINFDRIYVT